jgi:hypothetical protein
MRITSAQLVRMSYGVVCKKSRKAVLLFHIPNVTISQTRMPKLQMSDFCVKTLWISDSGAIHRIGSAP